MHGPGLARQVLQQHVRRERFVGLVRGRERADDLVAVEQRELAGTRLFLQAHQLELIELGEELVERDLIHDVAERTARVAGRREPHHGRGEVAEDVGLGVPDEHLVRRHSRRRR